MDNPKCIEKMPQPEMGEVLNTLSARCDLLEQLNSRLRRAVSSLGGDEGICDNPIGNPTPTPGNAMSQLRNYNGWLDQQLDIFKGLVNRLDSLV